MKYPGYAGMTNNAKNSARNSPIQSALDAIIAQGEIIDDEDV